MEIGKLGMLNPVICDVSLEYVDRRQNGLGRDEAVTAVRKNHEAFLHDDIGRSCASLGLGITLANKRELTEAISAEALGAIVLLRERLGAEHVFSKTLLREAEKTLRDESRKGPEAHYARLTEKYNPGWLIGDTFSHMITHPKAELLGLSGWYFVFQKIGSFLTDKLEHRQFVFIYLAEPGHLPKNAKDLHQLYRVTLTNQFSYIGSFSFSSKRNEASFELQKLGNFPEIDMPVRMEPFLAYTCYSLFGKLKRNDRYLNYEEDLLNLLHRTNKR